MGGKSGDRDIPISPKLEPYLIAWDNLRPKHSRYFFTTLKGKRVNDRYLRDFIKRYGKRIDLGWIHPHTLRHTFATQALKRNDINTPDLQYLLGHKALSSTQVYTHVEPKDLYKKLREDKEEKKDEDLKNLIDQLIEQQKLTMKVLEAITERIKE
ncbi:Tyrosine recombinase XerC [subsurface metagenome]